MTHAERKQQTVLFGFDARVRQQDRIDCWLCQHWGDLCLRSPHSLTKLVGAPFEQAEAVDV